MTGRLFIVKAGFAKIQVRAASATPISAYRDQAQPMPLPIAPHLP